MGKRIARSLWLAWVVVASLASAAPAANAADSDKALGVMPNEVRAEIERIAGLDVRRLVGALTGRDTQATVKIISYLNRRGTRPLIDEMEAIARYDQEACGIAPSEKDECEAGPVTDSRSRLAEVRRLARITPDDRSQILGRIYLATLVLSQEVTSEVLSKIALASATACREAHEPQCGMLSERVTVSWAWVQDLVYLARERASGKPRPSRLTELESKITERVVTQHGGRP